MIAVVLILGFALVGGAILVQMIRADFCAWRGHGRLEAGDWAGAVEDYQKSLALNDSAPAYHAGYAQAMVAAAEAVGDRNVIAAFLEVAEEQYKKAIASNPLDGESWFGLARVSWWLSRFEGHKDRKEWIETYLTRALMTDPNNGKYLFGLVNYYFSSGEEDKGLTYAKRLARVHPATYGHLKSLEAWTPSEGRGFKEALTSARRNIFVNREALATLTTLAEAEGNWSEALRYAQDWARLVGPEEKAEPLFRLGRYHLKLAQKEESRKAFVEALKLSRDRVASIESLFWFFNQTGAWDFYLELTRAAAGFDASVKHWLPFLSGRIFWGAGEGEEARRQFKLSLNIQETAEARRFLAEIALAKQDWGLAEAESRHATELEPGNHYYYFLNAHALQGLNKPEAALKSIEKAIKLSPQPNPHYFNNQAWSYWGLGQWREAIRAWEEAGRLDPKNAHYKQYIAMAYKQMKDYDSSRKYLEAALELDPNNEEAKRQLIEILSLKKGS